MPGRIDFEFTFPRPGSAHGAEPEGEVPVFRIAFVADFAGAARDADRWIFRRADVDTFDAEFRRAAPRLTVALGDAEAHAVELAFAALDD